MRLLLRPLGKSAKAIFNISHGVPSTRRVIKFEFLSGNSAFARWPHCRLVHVVNRICRVLATSMISPALILTAIPSILEDVSSKT